LATSSCKSRLSPRICILTVTVPKFSGSKTSVIVRVEPEETVVVAVGELDEVVEAPSSVSAASFCTVSITCCIGDRVGPGANWVSTETDLTIETGSDPEAAVFENEDETASLPAAVAEVPAATA